MKNGEEVVVLRLPDCNLCYMQNSFIIHKALYDGRVKGETSWAYMCEECFKENGVGLGVGKGQRLILKDNK